MTLEDLAESIDPRDLLEAIDPDWRDHFFDPWDAVNYYKRYASVEYEQAVRETT